MPLAVCRFPICRKHIVAGCTAAGAVLFALGATTLPAVAQVDNYVLFKSIYNQQTSPSAFSTYLTAFDVRLFEAAAGDATTATLTYPGTGSPEDIPISTYSTSTFDANSTLSTQAAMDAAFPVGTYTANWTAGTFGPGSASIDYTEDAYADDTPLFDPSTFADLGSENAGQPITLDWNSFVTGSVADSSFVFLNIYNAGTDATVFSDTFLPATTTSLTIPADTLQPGTDYLASLDFSNRISGSSNGIPTTFGFDRVTEAALDTTAPEPGSLPLAVSAVLIWMPLLGAGARRRVAAPCAARPSA
jgi:hypothetical protein